MSSNSSISASSVQIPHRDSPFCIRSTSSSSSTSSISSAYLWAPSNSLKRVLPADMDRETSSSGQRMKLEAFTPPNEVEPLWVGGFNTSPLEYTPTPGMEYGRPAYPTPPLNASIWSTETTLPMLPHISTSSGGCTSSTLSFAGARMGGEFEVPKQWDFESVLKGRMARGGS